MARVTAEDVRLYLQGIIFPATPETVVEQARRNGAPPEVIRSLQALPAGEWHNMDRIVEVWARATAGGRDEGSDQMLA